MDYILPANGTQKGTSGLDGARQHCPVWISESSKQVHCLPTMSNLSEITLLPVHMPFVKQPALPLALVPLFPSSLKSPEHFNKAGWSQAIPRSPTRILKDNRGLLKENNS